jgi:hypothetical protein
MAELGREEEVLLLFDLACGVHERRSALLEVLRLRRDQHERMASASTYSLLRRAANAMGARDIEREAARLALRERDLGGLVDALLDEGDVEGDLERRARGPGLGPRIAAAPAPRRGPRGTATRAGAALVHARRG